MSYNFHTDVWNMSYFPMNIGRLYPGIGMTADETKIIVAGGKARSADDSRYLDTYTVEIYTLATDSWTQGTALPGNIIFASVAIGDSLVALTEEENTVYEYDMTEDSWVLKVDIVSNAVGYNAVILLLGENYPYCG